MIIRLAVEKFIFKPIGLRAGMKESKRSYPKSNTELETAFRKSSTPSHQDVIKLSAESKLTQIEVNLNTIDPNLISPIILSSWFIYPPII